MPTTEGWLRTREWIGDTNRSTERFTIEGDWKIVWRTGVRPSEQPLQIRAFDVATAEQVALIRQNGEAVTSSLLLQRSGTFYLEISGGAGVWYLGIEVPAGRPFQR